MTAGEQLDVDAPAEADLRPAREPGGRRDGRAGRPVAGAGPDGQRDVARIRPPGPGSGPMPPGRAPAAADPGQAERGGEDGSGPEAGYGSTLTERARLVVDAYGYPATPPAGIATRKV